MQDCKFIIRDEAFELHLSLKKVMFELHFGKKQVAVELGLKIVSQ